MKKSSLAIIAILALASLTMLFIGEAPSTPDTRLPALLQAATDQENQSTGDTDEIRTPSSAGEVVFPHLEHIDDFGIECQECHHEVNATALNMPHEKYFDDFWIECGVCHHDGDEPEQGPIACSSCHHERPNGVSDQTLSSKVVIHKNCWECHDIGTGADASGECSFCHSGDKTSFAPADSEDDQAR